MPGSTFRPLASRPSAARPWRAPTAPISPSSICSDVSTNSPPSSAWPPSIKMSVMMPHFVSGEATGRAGRGLVFCKKILDRELAEIGQRLPQGFVVPVPPGKLGQPVGYRFGKPPADRSRRVAGNDGVGRHVLGDDGAGRDHRAGADAAARQHDGAMSDPDVVTDMDAMAAPPFEEFGLVALAREIRAGAIGEVRLRGAVHRVIAGVDPRHRRDRAELSDRRVGDLRVVHDIGIIVHRHFLQDRPRADLAIGAELDVMQFGAWVHRRIDGKHLAGHAGVSRAMM